MKCGSTGTAIFVSRVTHCPAFHPAHLPAPPLQVTEETDEMRFNTALAAMMEFVNGAYKWEARPREALRPFILLLAPYAPHLGEPGVLDGGGCHLACAHWCQWWGSVEHLFMRPSPPHKLTHECQTTPPVLPQRRRCGQSWAAAAAAAAAA